MESLSDSEDKVETIGNVSAPHLIRVSSSDSFPFTSHRLPGGLNNEASKSFDLSHDDRPRNFRNGQKFSDLDLPFGTKPSRPAPALTSSPRSSGGAICPSIQTKSSASEGEDRIQAAVTRFAEAAAKRREIQPIGKDAYIVGPPVSHGGQPLFSSQTQTTSTVAYSQTIGSAPPMNPSHSIKAGRKMSGVKSHTRKQNDLSTAKSTFTAQLAAQSKNISGSVSDDAGFMAPVPPTQSPPTSPNKPGPPPLPPQIRLLIKDVAFYCTPKGMIPGVLSITNSIVTFEPDIRVGVVQRGVVGGYQVIIALIDVLEVASISLPKVTTMDKLFETTKSEDDVKHLPEWIRNLSLGVAIPDRAVVENPEDCAAFLQIMLKQSVGIPLTTTKDSVIPEESIYEKSSSGFGRTDDIIIPSEHTGTSFARHDRPRSHSRTSSHHSDKSSDRGRRDSQDAGRKSRVTLSEGVRSFRPRALTVGEGGMRLENETLQHSIAKKGKMMDGEFAHPFVLFRLSSAKTVKEITRALLEEIDKLQLQRTEGGSPSTSRGKAARWFTHVPLLSNDTFEAILGFGEPSKMESHWLASDERAGSHFSDGVIAAEGEHNMIQPFRRKFGRSQTAPFMSHEYGSGAAGYLFRESPPKLETIGGCRAILSDQQAWHLSMVLPPTIAIRTWRLLFDTSIHGISFKSFYRHCERAAPILLVIRDDTDTIFGAYIAEPLRESRHYYGGGESFVFSFRATRSSSQAPSASDMMTFKWTGKNQYYVYTDARRIALGGGGSFAIMIDADFLQGHSGCSPTFDNEMLSGREDFTIKGLQVWTFSHL